MTEMEPAVMMDELERVLECRCHGVTDDLRWERVVRHVNEQVNGFTTEIEGWREHSDDQATHIDRLETIIRKIVKLLSDEGYKA